MFNIVLVHPQIPNNTGNIGRLCVGTNAVLHLIEPIGFSLDHTMLLRAGLDYWPHLQLNTYSSWQHFRHQHPDKNLVFFSAAGKKSFYDCPFQKNDFLIFGRESDGLPTQLKQQFTQQTYHIPIINPVVRSYNLGNSVAMVLGEGIRKIMGDGVF